jgi:hypothetical protein
MKKKTALPRIPENCCAACTFARTEKSDVFCFVDPPKEYCEADGEKTYSRGYPILANDPPCRFFKPKEHA